MLTPWGEALDKTHVLPEYPRPQLRRESYLNLNGLWDYAITASADPPENWDGKILVPFSPECELSGVNRTLQPGQFLWYRRFVDLPDGFLRSDSSRILLHFGAADYVCSVFLGGKEVFRHVGGYTPFAVDVTDAASAGGFELLVRIIDATDQADQTRGKQKLKPGGIWYAAQSGIWQTVWMECVPENYIRGLRILPRFDTQELELWVAGEGECQAEYCGCVHSFPAGQPAVLPVPEMHPWSPEDPFLYDLRLTLGDDHVESYFAMRKFSVETDQDGRARLFLNGVPYFHNGVLDQGYWCDGFLTAPSDEALVFDIETAKRMGFNMLRKHVKVEPLRWYYHCDRLGMLVWQDIPNGGTRYNPLIVSAPLVTGIHIKDDRYSLFGRKRPESRQQYYNELHEVLNTLINCPCVAMWVPFNEGWGQFDAEAVCSRILETDDTRTIDHASGWHDQGIGNIRSEHVYFRPYRFAPDLQDRAVVLSEFGGYTLRIQGHSRNGKTFGYKRFDSANSFRFALAELYRQQIAPACAEGLSAAVYTQLSDVETELNGLLTYDRRAAKVSPDLLRNIIRIGTVPNPAAHEEVTPSADVE